MSGRSDVLISRKQPSLILPDRLPSAPPRPCRRSALALPLVSPSWGRPKPYGPTPSLRSPKGSRATPFPVGLLLFGWPCRRGGRGAGWPRRSAARKAAEPRLFRWVCCFSRGRAVGVAVAPGRLRRPAGRKAAEPRLFRWVCCFSSGRAVGVAVGPERLRRPAARKAAEPRLFRWVCCFSGGRAVGVAGWPCRRGGRVARRPDRSPKGDRATGTTARVPGGGPLRRQARSGGGRARPVIGPPLAPAGGGGE